MNYKMETLRELCLMYVLKRIHPLEEATVKVLPLPLTEMENLQNIISALKNWLAKHEAILPEEQNIFFWIQFIAWRPNFSINDLLTAINLLQSCKSTSDSESLLSFQNAFRLASMYCLQDFAFEAWEKFPENLQRQYLAERTTSANHFDPVLIFWAGMVGGRPWLSDSYLVRAFYWSAEYDYLEALEFFWSYISQEHPESVIFRCTRGFQLAVSRGSFNTMMFLWRQTNAAQHKAMIESALCGAYYALQFAVQRGCVGIVRFLFREANADQRKIMILSSDCCAFKEAIKQQSVSLVKEFIAEASRLRLKSIMLQNDNCFVIRTCLESNNQAILETIWNSCNVNEQDNILRQDKCMCLVECNNACEWLWRSLTFDQKSIFLQQQLVPEIVNKVKVHNDNFDVCMKDMIECVQLMDTFFVEIASFESFQKVIDFTSDRVQHYLNADLNI